MNLFFITFGKNKQIYNEKNNFNIDYDCLYTYYKCTSKSQCLTK